MFECVANRPVGTELQETLSQAIEVKDTGVRFAIPALIYCVYNNGIFISLMFFDPSAFEELLNMRVLFTGLLYQYSFNKPLGKKKWAALGVLMLGCFVKEYDPDVGTMLRNLDLLPIVAAEAFLSSLAGVYNEFLVKSTSSQMSLSLQMVYLCFFSILFNGIVLLVLNPIHKVVEIFSHILSQNLLFLVIINGAAIGVVTSLILKYLNSIWKVYASSMEMIMTALASNYLFNQRITLKTIASIGLISLSLFVYNFYDTIDKEKELRLVKQEKDERERGRVLDEGMEGGMEDTPSRGRRTMGRVMNV
eukprot:TRINITY_DN658_c1_g1_i6.p1 TRINITY_DN658_c1_g1~~TRINITY_DN658_c1_g1_i6.p1  ORF type:complete len:306 (-),score=78.69 TRINITY_DN658_c1_g1_i6:961-1878(-)